MMSPIASMEFASSSSKLPRKYDVLINFNGEDIRRKFVSHLDSALSAVGLTTFLHGETAVKGMHIQQPILNLCRVIIVVFTKTYSQSAWCLHELQQIIKWQETYSRHILPVYYEIQPSDVRLQKGNFGKDFKATAQQTFSRQELEHGMSRWSYALTKTADFFGWDESNYRSDAKLVEKIVKSVLNLPVLSATKFPVGLESQVEDVIQIIKNKSTKVCIIGIYGEGGSGKTTLAKAIFHQVHGKFTHKSFIEDIAQVSQTRERVHLQEQLLWDVLKTKMEICSVEMGRSMIEERLSGKRMLIVLDDMDEHGRLLDLEKTPALFGKGTVIIITTRDKCILRIRQAVSVFEMKLMNENDSLELLSWHAFREPKPKEEYNVLAKSVVFLCRGLPLALEVIGTYLYERTKEEWHRVYLKLVKIDEDEVPHILKISFDSLQNQMEKYLFLDVCCFFIGKSRGYVRKILNGCGVDADSGIRVLIERNLIQVKKNNKYGMHPLLRDMGRGIIREISRKEHWKNNIVWDDGDTEYALSNNTLFSSHRTKVIQRLPSKLFLGSTDCFEPCPTKASDTSRILELAGHSENPSKKLRWVSLQGFPTKYLPNDFDLNDSIVIDIKHSLFEFVWKQPQVLSWLKVLNLSHSKYLRKTPDFSRLPSLEQLILKDCPKLGEVHQSIGCLCNLLVLNLKDCTSLSNLTREIYKLKSLKTLVLSGCSKIFLVEKDIMQMESLITLIAENTDVKQVPFSIVSSKNIGYISLRQFEGLSLSLFPSIIRSRMSPTMNPLSYFRSLMDMEDNSWEYIAPFLSNLANLRSVFMQCDPQFQLSKQLRTLLVEYGVKSTESGISKHHLTSCLIGVGRYKELFDDVSYSISQVLASSESCDVSLPGDNDPYWLAYMGEEHSISFTVPQDRVMKGMALWVVYLSTSKIIERELTTILIVNYTKCTLHLHNHGTEISFSDEDWDCIMSNLGSGDKVEIFVTFGHGLVIKNTAVYLIYGEPNKTSRIRFINKI